MPGSTALPAALGPDRPPQPSRASSAATSSSSSSSPRKSKRRFDIESLLAEPEAPRRSPPGPNAWPPPGAPAPAWPFGHGGGGGGGMLPFPALFLAEPPPPPAAAAACSPLPLRPCAHPGCPRPVAGLDLSSCILAHSLGAPLSWRSGGPCKMKRVRTVFTPEQLERLEKEFLKQQYMVGTERVDLAATLHLTETQVKVWFQNRRIKWRKQSLEQKEARRTQVGAAPAKQSEEKDTDQNDIDVED